MTKYIDIARALVNETGRHVSFLLFRDRIVSIGINNPYKTHPMSLKYNFRGRDDTDIRYDIGIHSELSAVIRLGREDLQKHSLINVRINRENQIAMSKPCHGCLDMIKRLRIGKVLFTNKSGEFSTLI